MAKFDRITEHILRVLREEGRISNLDLSERVGLSASACLRRVQELERTGVITGYRASLNWTRLGLGFVAYLNVGLNDHSKAAQEAFEEAMRGAPQVREYHNITGAYEYLLRVECADVQEYKTFHADKLGILPQVSSIQTHVVIGSSKDERT